MNSELMPVLLIILFSITTLGFIMAINARGTARTIVSYILSALLLFASVYVLLDYLTIFSVTQQLQREKILEREGIEKENLALRKEEQRIQKIEKKMAEKLEEKVEEKIDEIKQKESIEKKKQIQKANARDTRFLVSVIKRASILARRVKATNFSDESIPVEEYMTKSSYSQNKAYKLMRELNSRKMSSSSANAAKRTVKASLNTIISSAKLIERYFKAENADEEAEYEQAFSSAIDEATATLNRARYLISK